MDCFPLPGFGGAGLLELWCKQLFGANNQPWGALGNLTKGSKINFEFNFTLEWLILAGLWQCGATGIKVQTGN